MAVAAGFALDSGRDEGGRPLGLVQQERGVHLAAILESVERIAETGGADRDLGKRLLPAQVSVDAVRIGGAFLGVRRDDGAESLSL